MFRNKGAHQQKRDIVKQMKRERTKYNMTFGGRETSAKELVTYDQSR